MKPSHSCVVAGAPSFDERNLVSFAGFQPVMALAGQAELSGLIGARGARPGWLGTAR